MSGKIKKTLLTVLSLWLVLVAVTGILFPRYQKDQPELSADFSAFSSDCAGERILCIDDNQQALLSRLQMIHSAKDELILSTYYLADDDSGRDIMSALLDASDRGVRVRILVDGFCEFLNLRFSDSFRQLVRQENVTAKVYNPVNLLCPWNTNYRMHDKYMIADGTAYILGGRNAKNVSLGEYPGEHDIDRDILVYDKEGKGSVKEIEQYFEEIWAHPRARLLSPFAGSGEKALKELRARYENLQARYPQAFLPADYENMTSPVNGIKLLYNPVNVGTKSPVLWTQLMGWMGQGRDVLVQTPYIICNRTMYRDLYGLTREGREIRILTNSPVLGANPCGCADYLNQRRNLRKTGAEIWEYAGGNSSHTKTVIIDDHISIVGSFNFDMRSTYLDTEMMLVIDSPELNSHLRGMYDEYLKQSRCMQLNGETVLGEAFEQPKMGLVQGMIYRALRLLILPLRHLL